MLIKKSQFLARRIFLFQITYFKTSYIENLELIYLQLIDIGNNGYTVFTFANFFETNEDKLA
jgi:hypothetical protein